MIEDKELEWWCKEYPELTEEEILDVLEAFEEEELNNSKDD